MSHLYARTVFFVTSAESALRYYTEELGFTLDWDSHEGVLQVSLMGFELILNEGWKDTVARIGHGRVFIGLEDEQGEPFRSHIRKHGIQTYRVPWGRPTLAIPDQDRNELYFWIPNDDFSDLGKPAIETAQAMDIGKQERA